MPRPRPTAATRAAYARAVWLTGPRFAAYLQSSALAPLGSPMPAWRQDAHRAALDADLAARIDARCA